MNLDDRRTSAVVVTIGGLAFVVLAVILVPWDPIPGPDPVSPSAESVFTAAQIARAEEFSFWARMWSWTSLALSILVACWFGFSSIGRRLVQRLPGPWWVQVVLAVAAVVVAIRLVTLPFGFLAHRHLVEYGLSTQSLGEYLVDVAKGQLIEVVTTSLALLLIIGCARRWSRAWPAVAGGVLGGLVLAGSWAYPVLVEPLFNDFEPLPSGTLRSEILELADRQGVEVGQVLVADASRRTTTLNAYVSGLGGTRRVVVYDNLVEDLPTDQTLSVVAHEFAHAKHRDVLVGSGLGAAGVVFAVGLLGMVGSAIGQRRGAMMNEAVAVPLVLALVAVGSFLASPVQNTVSRQIETRADVDALQATGDSETFETMQRQLTLRSLGDPTPPSWSQFWFGSHPTVLERLAIANGRLHK